MLGFDKSKLAAMTPEERMAGGRNIGEPAIITRLKQQGVNLVPVGRNFQLDAIKKIDCFLNGDQNEPAQIKLRTSIGKEDILYEVCLDHNDRVPLRRQINNPRQMGRDFKGTSVKHYFVLSSDERAIYYTPAQRLRELVMEAIEELENNWRANGILQKPFTAKNGVQLRPTSDPYDGRYKVMAFIPPSVAATKIYKGLKK
jgi:hypothetical protein